MQYFALACDYDGTIANNGLVAAKTLSRLHEIRASGRYLILLTGRTLPDIKRVFADLWLFHWVVAENGALLYEPASEEETQLAPEVPKEFVEALQRRQVSPLETGRVIVATREPNEAVILDTIRELGLALQVVFNKGAVMVLPAGVTKATGLAEALSRLGLSAHNVVGIGDAENDHAFLQACEMSVAVANALPAVGQQTQLRTRKRNGAGVSEIAGLLLKDDLQAAGRRLNRQLVLGKSTQGLEVGVPIFGGNVLVAGPSGGGKSTLTKSFLESLSDSAYQFCVIDPEGDYEHVAGAVVLGGTSSAPDTSEVLTLMKNPAQNVVVNLLGVELEARPAYYLKLLSDLLKLRANTGRPHWIVVDEAHHVLPRRHEPGAVSLPAGLVNVLYVTLEPESMLTEALQLVQYVIAVGSAKVLSDFANVTGAARPTRSRRKLEPGEALIWKPTSRPRRFWVAESRSEHQRHKRKYAEGNLAPELSFYFRGKDRKLNLRAQNLIIFAQLARGVDADTWSYHLVNGDYQKWFQDVIKDEELAHEAEPLAARGLSAKASRRRILEAIRQRYTLPSSSKVNDSAHDER
jgi:HAD superfamily hydrolase (TIGR01484 family)